MNLSSAVLIALALVWAVVLIPELLRRRSSRMGDSINTFNRRMSALGGTTPRSGLRPTPANVIQFPAVARAARPAAAKAPRVSPAQRKRRQDVIVTLGVAALLTLVLRMAFGGTFLLALHLVADVLLAGYLVLLLQADRAPAPARPAVRPEPIGRVQPVAMRRQA